MAGGGAVSMVLRRDLALMEVLTRIAAVEIRGKKQGAEEKGKVLEGERITEIGGGGGRVLSLLPRMLPMVEVLLAIEIGGKKRRAARGKGKGKGLGEASGGGVGGGGGVSRVVILPQDLLIVEVLTRLPAKSLMRFKTVSKHWRSTISDPSFSKAHHDRARSRSGATRLFIAAYRDDSGSSSLSCFFSTLPRHGKSVLLDHFTVPESDYCRSYKYNGATEVINGLFCLYADNRVWICNISTREIMELPSSDLVHENAKGYSYSFGFSSTSKEYKLVKLGLFPYKTRSCCVQCEILTLGTDTSWRRLRMVQAPQIEFLERSSVSIDGAICFWHHSGDEFIVFNCKDESFQVIDHPPRAFSERSLWHSSVRRVCSLVQFRGHFAVASGIVDQKLQLWVLELEYIGKSLSYEWIKEVIDIPHDFPIRGFSFLGNLPTGEMLLTGVETKKSAIPVYSYDHIERKFEKFEIGKFPISEASIRMVRVNYCEEDITPLSCIFPFQGDFSP